MRPGGICTDGGRLVPVDALAARRLAQVAGRGAEQVGVLAAALPEQVVEQRAAGSRRARRPRVKASRVAVAHRLHASEGSTRPERSASRISTLSAHDLPAPPGRRPASQPRRSQIFATRKLFFAQRVGVGLERREAREQPAGAAEPALRGGDQLLGRSAVVLDQHLGRRSRQSRARSRRVATRASPPTRKIVADARLPDLGQRGAPRAAPGARRSAPAPAPRAARCPRTARRRRPRCGRS